MTWDVQALPRVDLSLVGDLRPIDVLYEFDGPCIFSMHTSLGTLALAYLSEQLDESNRFLVASTSQGTIDDLRQGLVSVRESLRRGSIWVVETNLENQPVASFHAAFSEIPDKCLPQAGIMLLASLQPAVVVRLTGEDITPGNVPASAIAKASDIANKGLKPIFEWAASALRQGIGGRPPDWLRNLYSLRTQGVAFGSLELALNPTQIPAEAGQGSLWEEADLPSAREIDQSAWNALRRGLVWLTSDNEYPDDAPEASAAILESLSRIAPASTGPVVAVELSGRLVARQPDKPFRIDRAAGKRIRHAIRTVGPRQRQQPVQFKMLVGLVRECDLDVGSFIVRGEGLADDVPIYAESERLLEIAFEAFAEQTEVAVVVRTDALWTAIDILPTTPQSPA